MKGKTTPIERESFGIRLNPELFNHLKLVAAKNKLKVNALLEIAIIDLLRKYKEINS